MPKSIGEEVRVDELRQRLGGMSDHELLRFGWVTKFACAGEGQTGSSDREDPILQLHEAREEWNRRKPGLPLRESF